MTTATETQPTKHTNDCVRQRARFGAQSEAGNVCSCGGLTTETESAITLSNFRVTYRAPRYEGGRVLYDGYCAILADDAALNGAEVRVFDVPDVDEGQLAAAMFACEAMNRYPAMLAAVKKFIDAYSGPNAGRLGNGQARRSLDEFQSLLATTTSK